jgi:Tfp pilus assembly protein PilF
MNPHVQRAEMLYHRGRFADAERELGMALQKDSEDPWAYALLGACRAAQEDFARADELGRRAMALAPYSADIRHLVACIQLARNDLKRALQISSEAIEIDPNSADFYATRATVYTRQKAWDKALADCETALAIEPDHIEAINVRSRARRATGDSQSAAAELEHALRIDPEDPYSHVNLGWTYLQDGQMEAAERHFREALRLQPELDAARSGVLETLKAKVPVYRWVLGYFFWMQTKAAKAQWAIIIGLYFVYRIVQGIASSNPTLAPFLMPLIIAYLLFVMATWFSVPLADAALMLHPFGRLALSKQEKREAAVVVLLLVTVTTLVVVHTLAEERSLYLIYAWLIGASGLPLAMSFKFDLVRPRRILQYTAGILTAASLFVILQIWTPIWSLLLPSSVLHSVMVLLTRVLMFSVLGTLILTNILATRQWRR